VADARAKLTVLRRQLLVDRVLIDGWQQADVEEADRVGHRWTTAAAGFEAVEM
jgi:hypothetical protein